MPWVSFETQVYLTDRATDVGAVLAFGAPIFGVSLAFGAGYAGASLIGLAGGALIAWRALRRPGR